VTMAVVFEASRREYKYYDVDTTLAQLIDSEIVVGFDRKGLLS